jgi:hypothetical protein
VMASYGIDGQLQGRYKWLNKGPSWLVDAARICASVHTAYYQVEMCGANAPGTALLLVRSVLLYLRCVLPCPALIGPSHRASECISHCVSLTWKVGSTCHRGSHSAHQAQHSVTRWGQWCLQTVTSSSRSDSRAVVKE